jgi:hypothetical protein
MDVKILTPKNIPLQPVIFKLLQRKTKPRIILGKTESNLKIKSGE